MKPSPEHIPVIIGIGEISEKPDEAHRGREPLHLMHDAAKLAVQDAGISIKELDSLDIVMPMSWRYEDLAKQLSHELGVSPSHAQLGPSGGESPLRYIHTAAQRIASGQNEVALIVGGEAQHTLTSLQRQGITPDWTPFAMNGPNFADIGDAVHPLSSEHGLYMPVNVYGFFEAASSQSWGHSPRTAQNESAAIWERYSRAAHQNPYSWKPALLTSHDIQTVTPKNRMIGGPYPKSMVANMNVNQSAAVIVTSLSKARAAGIHEDNFVYITGGAGANEPRNFLSRDNYKYCAAQDAVLTQMQNISKGNLGLLELYSCFPCVPKMAKRVLNLPNDFMPTVTGGLSFFGAPLNNYMTHASCAMVRAIRGGAACGTLYGQGEYMTKHFGLRLSKQYEGFISVSDTQAKADSLRGPIPPLSPTASGPMTVETFTMMYNRDGSINRGVIIAKTQDGSRTLASVLHSDSEGIAALISDTDYPIGLRGIAKRPKTGAAIWHFS